MTSSPTPRCAMLMTVYNGGRFLRPAVESVLASRFSDFEFVIVDNVSTDGSREYLQSLIDPRIRVIANEQNLGQTGALNVGLREVRAPFVARLDADDINLPDRMGLQVEALEKDRSLALIGGQTVAIDETGRPLFRTRFPTSWETIRSRLTLQNCFDHSSVMFRRDAALADGGYPADFAVSQDFALFSRLMRADHRLINLPATMSKVRMHPAQTMAQGGSEKEIVESIRVATANQAWHAGRAEDPGQARTLHRLWSGIESPDRRADDPDPFGALSRFFAEHDAPRRQKALLSLFLLGGRCDGRRDVRFWLLRNALKNDPTVVFHPEFSKRLLRATLSPDRLAELRGLMTAR